MPLPRIQVLLALRDAAHFAPLAQALLHPDASITLLSLRSADGLLAQLRSAQPSLLVLELDPVATLLEKVREQHPNLPVVAVLEKPTAQLAFAASRLGAEDVLTLPLDEAQIAERMHAVLDKLAQNAAVPLPEKAPAATLLTKDEKSPAKMRPQLIGSNPRMAEIRELVGKVAATDATVLIRGESGVGKEIVARMVFESSLRVHQPFVKVNCAAIPNDLLESELFGYDVGAFTGATRQKPGKFELADHGTLFLDEIGEMHPMLQAKLLHVLQDGQFSRLGGKRDISVNVRLLCATNKLLEQRVAEGLFREDLYYRINVITIQIPPLRERRDEIPLLTRYFLEKYAAEYHRPFKLFSPQAEQQMQSYVWPGNIRELENLCKRFVIVGNETQILREMNARLPANETAPAAVLAEPNNKSVSLRGRKPTAAAGPSLLEIGRKAAWQAERQAIQQMLLETHWNRREAANRLQVSYKALLNKIKQLELEENGTPQPGDPSDTE